MLLEPPGPREYKRNIKDPNMFKDAKLGGIAVRKWVSAFVAGWAISGCNVGGAASAGNDTGKNPHCTTYCEARKSNGCGGVESICLSSCTAEYHVADGQGSCKQAYTLKVDCGYSKAVLDLGCAPTYEAKAAVCKAETDAFNACVKQRDGK